MINGAFFIIIGLYIFIRTVVKFMQMVEAVDDDEAWDAASLMLVGIVHLGMFAWCVAAGIEWWQQ